MACQLERGGHGGCTVLGTLHFALFQRLVTIVTKQEYDGRIFDVYHLVLFTFIAKGKFRLDWTMDSSIKALVADV